MTLKRLVILALLGGVGYGVFNHYYTHDQDFRWQVWKAKVAAREWWVNLTEPIGPSKQEMAEWDARHLEHLKAQVGTSNAAALQQQRMEQRMQETMMGPPGSPGSGEDQPSSAYPNDAYSPSGAYDP